MQNKANLKLRYLLSIKQDSEMNILFVLNRVWV